jgi:hypothetical protein
MELAHRWINRNLTKLELTVSLLILTLFISFFSRYMFIVFGKVEKSMIDRTLININTAMNYEVAFALMRNDTNFLKQLVLMNPMDIMADKFDTEKYSFNQSEINPLITLIHSTSVPSNYGGVVIDDSDPLLISGKWYFDQDDHFLFYKLNNSEFFTSDLDGSARIRFKIRLNYIDQDNDFTFTPSIDKFNSIQLRTIDQYEWSF